MRHVFRAVSLLSLVFLLQSCSRGDKPGDLLTSPGGANLDESIGVGTFENTCPVANDMNVSVDQDASVNFQLDGSDADGDALTYALITGPAHGTVVVFGGTGVAIYTPAPGYCGPDGFRFKVSDGSCDSNEATVSITVNCPPPPDGDGDGVPDADDDCPDSDLRESVWIGGCDTGVPNEIDGNPVDADGCSLADLVQHALDEAAAGADNHGRFVAAATRAAQGLARDGLIAPNQIAAIVHCVGQSDVELEN